MKADSEADESYAALVAQVDLLTQRKLSRSDALKLSHDLRKAALSDHRAISLALRAKPFLEALRIYQRTGESKTGNTGNDRTAHPAKRQRQKSKAQPKSQLSPKRSKAGKKNSTNSGTPSKKRVTEQGVSVLRVEGSKISFAFDEDGNRSPGVDHSEMVREAVRRSPSRDTSSLNSHNPRLPYGQKADRKKQRGKGTGSVYAILAGSPGSGKRR